MKGYLITVYGKVQGVWFRKYTQEKAISLQLNGYVMNQTDGTVFLEVYGNTKKLKELQSWLKNVGSPLSEVEKIQVHEIISTKQFTSFEINR